MTTFRAETWVEIEEGALRASCAHLRLLAGLPPADDDEDCSQCPCEPTCPVVDG